MYVCMCGHTYVYECVIVLWLTRKHVKLHDKCTCLYGWMEIYIHTYIHTYIHIRILSLFQGRLLDGTHTHSHTHRHTHVCASIHTYIYHSCLFQGRLLDAGSTDFSKLAIYERDMIVSVLYIYIYIHTYMYIHRNWPNTKETLLWAYYMYIYNMNWLCTNRHDCECISPMCLHSIQTEHIHETTLQQKP